MRSSHLLPLLPMVLPLLAACPTRQEAAPPGKASSSSAVGSAAVESVITELSPGACRQEADKSDPNETPYLICPGAAGYSLIVRRVDAGRRSIDIVTPTQRRFPLQLQEVVTRHMAGLDDKVEWRVAVKDGQRAPIALVVRLRAREDEKDPARVTRTLLAIAKVTPDEACITDRDAEGALPEAELRRVMDDAPARPCAAPLPRLTQGGVVIR